MDKEKFKKLREKYRALQLNVARYLRDQPGLAEKILGRPLPHSVTLNLDKIETEIYPEPTEQKPTDHYGEPYTGVINIANILQEEKVCCNKPIIRVHVQRQNPKLIHYYCVTCSLLEGYDSCQANPESAEEYFRSAAQTRAATQLTKRGSI